MTPYLRAANVKDCYLDLSDVKDMDFTPDEQDTYALVPGDTLVTEGSGSIDTVGATAQWDGDLDGVVCFQNTLMRLRARDGVAIPGYVYALGRHLYWSGKWASIASGTNILHVGATRAEKVPVPLPPLEVQRRIVDVVDHIDTAIDAAASVATETAKVVTAVRAGVLSRMGGVTTSTLGEVAEINLGRTPPRKEKRYWTDDLTHPFLTIAEMDSRIADPVTEGVTMAAIEDNKAKVVPAGALLMSFKLTIGRIAYAGRDLCTNEAIAWLDPKPDSDVLPEYLAAVLENSDLDRGANAAVKGKTLNKGSMSRIPIEIPPIESQHDAVEVIAAALDAESRATDQLDHLKRARRATVTALMSGERPIPKSYDELMETAV